MSIQHITLSKFHSHWPQSFIPLAAEMPQLRHILGGLATVGAKGAEGNGDGDATPA
jgi:hypothetical protein